MKWASAVIHNWVVWRVVLSTRIVNQAGPPERSKNETFQAGRPRSETVPSRCASVALCQNGTGCLTGYWGDGTQDVVPAAWFQARSPMMILAPRFFSSAHS